MGRVRVKGIRVNRRVKHNMDTTHQYELPALTKIYLICGLDRNIYNNVDQVSCAHEMWRMLEVTHQGTSSMKETKINILVLQY